MHWPFTHAALAWSSLTHLRTSSLALKSGEKQSSSRGPNSAKTKLHLSSCRRQGLPYPCIHQRPWQVVIQSPGTHHLDQYHLVTPECVTLHQVGGLPKTYIYWPVEPVHKGKSLRSLDMQAVQNTGSWLRLGVPDVQCIRRIWAALHLRTCLLPPCRIQPAVLAK